jgi:hypothetical protein
LSGFEPTIPALERAKTVHALDRAATGIGRLTNAFNFKLRTPGGYFTNIPIYAGLQGPHSGDYEERGRLFCNAECLFGFLFGLLFES